MTGINDIYDGVGGQADFIARHSFRITDLRSFHWPLAVVMRLYTRATTVTQNSALSAGNQWKELTAGGRDRIARRPACRSSMRDDLGRQDPI